LPIDGHSFRRVEVLMGAPSIEHTRALTTTHYDGRNRVDCIQRPLDAQGTVFSSEHDCMLGTASTGVTIGAIPPGFGVLA